MKRNVLFLAATLVATGSLLAAPKDDVQGAIKKLADASSYSWSSTPTSLAGGGGGGGGGGRRGGGPSSGKVSKTDGFAVITRAGRGGGAPADTVVKGAKSVTKNQDGVWETPEERAAGGGGGGGGAAFALIQNRLPTADAEDLLKGAKEIKMADGAYSSDLTTEAVAARLVGGGGRGGGQAPPPPTDAKGSVKFWIKDGMLAKYEYNVQGKTVTGQGDPLDVNRTTTVEIKDVGTTKVEVAEDAKKKLQ